MKLYMTLAILSALALSSCAGTGSSTHVAGNEKGSQPVNKNEVSEYKRAVLRCYKTGGTRVVKIQGQLRCYD